MAKTTMDGTEQTLFESTELGEYNGYVFLDKMQINDTIILKLYILDEEDDVYKLRDSRTFINVQSVTAVGFLPTVGEKGIKVTAQQTSGTYRVVSHQWVKR